MKSPEKHTPNTEDITRPSLRNVYKEMNEIQNAVLRVVRALEIDDSKGFKDTAVAVSNETLDGYNAFRTTYRNLRREILRLKKIDQLETSDLIEVNRLLLLAHKHANRVFADAQEKGVDMDAVFQKELGASKNATFSETDNENTFYGTQEIEDSKGVSNKEIVQMQEQQRLDPAILDQEEEKRLFKKSKKTSTASASTYPKPKMTPVNLEKKEEAPPEEKQHKHERKKDDFDRQIQTMLDNIATFKQETTEVFIEELPEYTAFQNAIAKWHSLHKKRNEAPEILAHLRAHTQQNIVNLFNAIQQKVKERKDGFEKAFGGPEVVEVLSATLPKIPPEEGEIETPTPVSFLGMEPPQPGADSVYGVRALYEGIQLVANRVPELKDDPEKRKRYNELLFILAHVPDTGLTEQESRRVRELMEEIDIPNSPLRLDIRKTVDTMYGNVEKKVAEKLPSITTMKKKKGWRTRLIDFGSNTLNALTLAGVLAAVFPSDDANVQAFDDTRTSSSVSTSEAGMSSLAPQVGGIDEGGLVTPPVQSEQAPKVSQRVDSLPTADVPYMQGQSDIVEDVELSKQPIEYTFQKGNVINTVSEAALELWKHNKHMIPNTEDVTIRQFQSAMWKVLADLEKNPSLEQELTRNMHIQSGDIDRVAVGETIDLAPFYERIEQSL